MNYKTYEITVQHKDSVKFIEVVAIDHEAAKADCIEAGYNVITITLIG